MDWSELWGQLTGAALGVIVGYLASEVLASLRRKSERRAVRSSVQAEIDQNVIEVRSLLKTMMASESRAHAFSQSLRPNFSVMAWETHLIHKPEAFSEAEVRALLSFYGELATIVSVWDQYDEASRMDRQSQVIIRSQSRQFLSQPVPAPGTKFFGGTAERLEPILGAALNQAEQFNLRLNRAPRQRP